MARTDDDRRFPYYPAFLDLRRKRVVVVGAGIIATGKVRGLLPCGPDPLVVIAPEASSFVKRSAREGRLTWIERDYADGDLAEADVCFAATNDRGINAIVAAEARRRRIPVLAVDDVPNCDFIAPSVITRGDLIIAMSTGGRSPAFARWVRERFDRDVPAHWGDLLDVVATAREQLGHVRSRVTPEQWLGAIDEELERQVQRGEKDEALRTLLRRLVPGADETVTVLSPLPLGPSADNLARTPDPTVIPSRSEESRDSSLSLGMTVEGRIHESDTRARGPRRENGTTGIVSLVGAGPGDPELLTLKGLRRLREADAVVHDRLVSSEILDYCRPDAERYDVGKSSGHHSRAQDEINALLIRLGRAGQRVVRLKGGDPFVFGRGGEEILALALAGITYEVIPGVSSALAAPAAAGIPVTHRGLASAVTIATGHARSGCTSDDHDWEALARVRGTLVFLMAVENLDSIVAGLMSHGRTPDEPAAMVQSGTTPEQRVIRSTLRDIVENVRAAGITPPAVLVVGDTVALAEASGPSAIASSRLTAGLETPQSDGVLLTARPL
jgi:uroporphyrin-III C-methyltransferase/precorrin-2 dehydrogenase/sirohydrochlorin ferrochelatase